MSDRMTPERLAELRDIVKHNLFTTHHGEELLAELNAVTSERDALATYGRHLGKITQAMVDDAEVVLNGCRNFSPTDKDDERMYESVELLLAALRSLLPPTA